MDVTTSLGEGFDLLPEIKELVRSAIADGLITSVSLKEYDQQVKTLKDAELEDYIQNLWDGI